MKTFLRLSILMAITVVIISCMGCKKDSDDGDDDSGNTNIPGALTASITPAEGWEKNSAIVPTWINKDERATGASIMLITDIVPSGVKTADEYVTYVQPIIKKSFKDAVFTATTHTKVGNRDAVEYTYLTSALDLGFKFRMVYILADPKAYTIQCCAFASDYDAVAADFQSMIDSYTLK